MNLQSACSFPFTEMLAWILTSGSATADASDMARILPSTFIVYPVNWSVAPFTKLYSYLPLLKSLDSSAQTVIIGARLSTYALVGVS